jgi:CDP-glucose 4,6-dehydratase
MEGMGIVSGGFWRGARVLVTGHTGFKGAWLSLWLRRLGAGVAGFSLDPPQGSGVFAASGAAREIIDGRGDVRSLQEVENGFRNYRPEIVFHLAAQPLVRRSYVEPVETYATNVMGTVNVLEAARRAGGVRALVVVTSDKCYDNRETTAPYRETDRMGGRDPYSSSKGCAELVTAAYRRSFFDGPLKPRVSSARAGNVIGGGDWAQDRLVPDCIRAFLQGEPVRLRQPLGVRPWQHVLEPLAGYLTLAESLYRGKEPVSGAYNFGPEPADMRTTWEVARMAAESWGPEASVISCPETTHPEAGLLLLDSELALRELGWRPRWPLEKAVRMTVDWYRRQAAGAAMDAVSLGQIEEYEECLVSPAPSS